MNHLRMGVSKNEPMLRDILNLGIASITPREREEIVNRHVNITIVTPINYGVILRVSAVVALFVGMLFFWNLKQRKLLRELREALAEVRTLRGIVPICAGCKKIRDDKGYWEQVDVYVREHTHAEFSHGMCPDCLQKYYADAEKEI